MFDPVTVSLEAYSGVSRVVVEDLAGEPSFVLFVKREGQIPAEKGEYMG